MLALAFAALALLVQPDTTFQTPTATPTVEAPDSVEEAVETATEDVRRFRVRPVFSPGSLYSGSKGFGVGGGIAMDHALMPDDHLQVEARLSQHLLGAFGEYVTGTPANESVFALVGASAWTTSKTRFYGYGPRSSADGDLFLNRRALQAEARVGWAPAGPRGVILQPTVRYRYDLVRSYEESVTGGIAALRPADRARLDATLGQSRRGIEVALSALRDSRDVRAMPVRGSYLQAEAARFEAIDGTGLGFTRVQATGYVFRPALFRIPFLPDRGAIFFRANAVVTREDSGDEPLPWVYLPDLDRDLLVGYPAGDFVGRDALSVGVGVRGVVAQAIGALLIEGVGMTQVGAAYDDIFNEFTPAVRLSQDRPADGEKVRMQPSLSVGLNLHFIDRERPLVGGLIGVGPGGVALASLRLVWGLGDYRPRLD